MSISMGLSSTEDHGTTSGLRRFEGSLLYAPLDNPSRTEVLQNYVAVRCAMMFSLQS
jgi:hypothetical protein